MSTTREISFCTRVWSNIRRYLIPSKWKKRIMLYKLFKGSGADISDLTLGENMVMLLDEITGIFKS